MIALLFLGITIATDFEGGNIGNVEQISASHFRCEVTGEVDQDKRNRQPSWFYFRLDEVQGRELVIDLTGFVGEYNYRPDNGEWARGMRPVYSYDNRTWRHFDSSEWDSKTGTVRIRIKPTANRLWIARLAPYTNQHLKQLIADLRKQPDFRETTVGKTVEGRPMPLLTITNSGVVNSKKKVVWLMARQHSWETGTSWVAEGALRFLLSNDPQAVRIRDGFIFKVFPMADPDGVFNGGVRFNRHGYDLNRHWETADASLMPEIHAQRQAILEWVDAGHRIDLFLTLHNTDLQIAERIEGPLTDGGPKLLQLAQRLSTLLGDTTNFYSPQKPRDTPVPKTPDEKGNMPVYHALVHERKIPALLVEQAVDINPKLGRPPTVEDRTEFGAGLVRAICSALEK